MTFGEKVKTLRKEKGLNQTQLAQAVGVSLRTIRGWEIEAATQSSMPSIRNWRIF